jgi:hypothetical protein
MPAPEVESVVPLYERPEPMMRVPTIEVPLPFKMPLSVVEPVPPFCTATVPVTFADVPPMLSVEVEVWRSAVPAPLV